MTHLNFSRPLTIAAILCIMLVGGVTGCERKGPTEPVEPPPPVNDPATNTQQDRMDAPEDNIRD